MKKYGKTEVDVEMEKKIQSREIVKEILDFGVNEFQKRQIIKLLSLELEDISIAQKISSIMKESEEEPSSGKILTLE
tara:strand:- start:398 stop:628 length:231 start_codon:yes stop_codon:yes gene_type:complete